MYWLLFTERVWIDPGLSGELDKSHRYISENITEFLILLTMKQMNCFHRTAKKCI